MESTAEAMVPSDIIPRTEGIEQEFINRGRMLTPEYFGMEISVPVLGDELG